MTTESDGSVGERLARSAPVGVAGLAVLGANVVAEIGFAPVPWTVGTVVAAVGATVTFGFLLPAIAAVAGDGVRLGGPVSGRAIFWAPMLIGVGLALTTAVSGGLLSVVEAVAGLVATGVAAAVAQRFLPTLAEPPDPYLAPMLVVWVILSSVFVGTLADVARPITELMVVAPALCGVGAVLLQVFHRAFAAWSRRTLWVSAAVVLVGGVGLIVRLAAWLPSLNSRLKLLVASSVLVVLTAVIEPLIREKGSALGARVWGVAALLAVCAGVQLHTVSIPERFGGLDPRTTAGLWVGVTSWADHDGDGFFSEEVGGNDCDDSDAERHPFAPSETDSCLPEVSFSARPGGGSITHDGDVLVVVVDAIRADVMAAAEDRKEFEAFDAIASNSVRFSRAYSPGNSTFTSIPSMLTGLGPNLLMTTVIEERPAEYQEFVRGRWFFDHVGPDVCRAMIAQSHDAASWLFPYYPRDLDVRVTETRVDESLHSSPFIGESLEKVLEECGDRRMALVLYADDPHLQLGQGHACKGGGVGGYDCYLDEIHAVDDALEGLIARLERAGRWERTAVLVTSDHGESFGERGHVGHTSNVFDEQVHVPLWLRVPGIDARVEETPVTGLSVAPTAASLAGGALPDRHYPSLLSFARSGGGGHYPPPVATSATGRMKKAWTSPQSALRDGDLKVVYDWRTARAVVYDLAADPGEQNPSTDHPELPRLRKLLLGTQRELLTRWPSR